MENMANTYRLATVPQARAKAILWVRGSTTKQEIESQKNDLRTMAIADGFKDDQCIYIGDVGLSARKLSDEYLKQFNKLMRTLEDDDNVTHVYCWEASRLARVEIKFYEFKDFALRNGVQFVLFAGGYRLFRKDGDGWDIDRGVDIALSIFVTMARQEMEIKNKRFERGRRHSKEQGKYNGGRFRLFGYDVVDKKQVPNTREADILNKMFTMYSRGGHSYTTLAKWLNDHDVRTSAGNRWTPQNISATLKNDNYCGDVDGRYPQLITRELFTKAASVRQANVKGTGKVDKARGKRVNLANKILKCKGCGSNYVSHGTSYNCFAHAYPEHPTNAHKDCENAPQVSMELMDRLLWSVAKVFEEQKLIIQRQYDRDVIKSQIKEMQTAITAKKAQIADLEERYNRDGNLYSKGRITEAELDARGEAIEREKAEIEKEIADLNKKVITWTDKDAFLRGVKRGGASLHYTDTDKYDIVHNWVSVATVEKCQKYKQSIEIVCGFEGIEFGRVAFIVNPHVRQWSDSKVQISMLSVPTELKQAIVDELELSLPVYDEPEYTDGHINITMAKVEEQFSENLQNRLDEVLEEMSKGRTAEDIQEEWRQYDEE